jgi:hypothetical protein
MLIYFIKDKAMDLRDTDFMINANVAGEKKSFDSGYIGIMQKG